MKAELLRDLDLNQVLDRDVEHLSGAAPLFCNIAGTSLCKVAGAVLSTAYLLPPHVSVARPFRLLSARPVFLRPRRPPPVSGAA